MHVYFSGIGGAGIGPLALIAHRAGFQVSGSDKQNSQYVDYLRHKGITDIHIGQDLAGIAAVHQARPIDWLVYSSAVAIENPDAPELQFARDNHIQLTKRDGFINLLLEQTGQAMIAIAGTHGKSTTTAMVVWLCKQIGLPISYALGAKLTFGDMGEYDENSKYFVYECDEFDRNFLAFQPALSLISGVSWDHHEIFPTREDYQSAFREFISQSRQTIIWQDDADYLNLPAASNLTICDPSEQKLNTLSLPGLYNRLDAWLAVQAVAKISDARLDDLVAAANRFPGLQRRMEAIAPGLYSDYAHTPEKIRGGLSVATEMAARRHQAVVVIYEPLTNRRQHFMKQAYQDCFTGASKVYWLPSYLAREDPAQPILTPEELISYLSNPSIAEAAERNDNLIAKIKQHLEKGDMVVGMAGGGGGSLDDWLRRHFAAESASHPA